MQHFVSATSEYSEAEYVIFGAPYDGTQCFRCDSRWAPQAIRDASWNLETYVSRYDVDMCDLLVHDLGDLELPRVPELADRAVRAAADSLVADGKLAVMFGGEHSLTVPVVSALVAAGRSVGVVCVDAHLDAHDEYEGTPYSHACTSRRLVEDAGCPVAVIGARSGSAEEYEWAAEHLTVFTPEDVKEIGAGEVAVRAVRELGTGLVYVSLDMDGVDAAHAPGVGTPEFFGLTPGEVRTIIAGLAPIAAGFDVVEIAPHFDCGQTALLAATMVREFICARAAGVK